MAQQIIVTILDDIDGSEAAETLTFALDGVSYEIDLSEKNAAKVRKALDPFIDKARKVKGGKVRSVSASKASGGKGAGTGEAAAIRVWAAAHNIAVPAKGRIPADVREQYEARTDAA